MRMLCRINPRCGRWHLSADFGYSVDVKNAVGVLIALVIATTLFAQSAPPDEQSAQKHIDQRIRVSERVLYDMTSKKVLPQPPWSNDKGHEKGEVTVGVLVDYDGKVKSTHVLSGDPVLGDVAENAVKQWQFRPFILNGEPVQMDSRVVLKFNKKHVEVVVGAR